MGRRWKERGDMGRIGPCPLAQDLAQDDAVMSDGLCVGCRRMLNALDRPLFIKLKMAHRPLILRELEITTEMLI